MIDVLGNELVVPPVGETPRPVPGQVWVITTDGADRGLVLMVRCHDDVVTAWPVTAVDAVCSAPAFLLQLAGVGDFAVWPEAEFGMTRAALGRCLGAPMDATQIEAVHDWAADAGQVPEGIVPFTVQHTDAALNALDKVCVFAWDIGDWPGPQGEVEVLDSEALRERNIDARQIARLLKVSPGTARALAEGRMVPTTDQLKAIAGQDDGPDVDLLTHANGPEVVALTLPRFKNDVWNLAQARGLDEATTRSTVWQEAVTLAARKTVNESETEEAENRIEMALKRLNKRYA